MKPRTRKLLAGIVAGAWVLTPLPRVGGAADPTPPGKGDGKKRRHADSAATPEPSKSGDFPFPILKGRPTTNLKLPEMDAAGKVLSQLIAQKATRIDEDRIQLEKMQLDLNKPDGKEDYHIEMPTSIFNLKTRFLSSNDPVKISTQDFELTGERMEFNTVEREGRLDGRVRMVIHNLKQLAGPQQEPTPKHE